ncbi:hypothetical protein C8R45DRAFT_167961 [Mycena sanguinolenta]|nr:hypothetical protein C8R45DRAFT_167961 [Mycena sanguinolenta]
MSNFTPPTVLPPDLLDLAGAYDAQSSTLVVQVDNCAAVFKLLTESPGIADSVTHLIIRPVHVALPSSDTEIFCEILAKLPNVRRCTLDGLWRRFPMHVLPGNPVIPPLDIPELILDFLMRQPVHELFLICIRIPTSVFWRFLTTVPKLYLQESVVVQEEAPAPMAICTEIPSLRGRSTNPFRAAPAPAPHVLVHRSRNPFRVAPAVLQPPFSILWF